MIAIELELREESERQTVVRDLSVSGRPPLLVLNTCQRLECYGAVEPQHAHVQVSRTWTDTEAFERLTRIAAGLESRILGELEVLGQVRCAYRQFNRLHQDQVELDRMFQDALALARKARRESGIDAKLTSLSGIAARHLLDNITGNGPLAVVGAGSLAGSVARYLAKRGKSSVRVTSRCPENAMNLAIEIGGFGAGLDDIAHLFDGVGGIVTATAAPHPVVFPQHIERALRPLTIVDLAVPQDCDVAVRNLEGVKYAGLETIEGVAQVNVRERRQRSKIAARLIRDGAMAWAKNR